MTIDECIEFAEDINATVTFPEDCDKDRQFFETIVELLEELKLMRNLDKTNFSDGYNKAIDDFISKAEEEKDNLYRWDEDEYENGMRAGYQYSIEIAEQLRAGD